MGCGPLPRGLRGKLVQGYVSSSRVTACPLCSTLVIATACEVLARRVIHQAPPEKLQDIMSARFRHKEIDGDISGRVSALEMAIDSHWCVAVLPRKVFWQGWYSQGDTVPYSCRRARRRTVGVRAALPSYPLH